MSNYSPLLDVLIKIKDYGGFVNSHSHLDRANTITPESMQRVNDHLFEKWKFVEKVKSESSEKDYEKDKVAPDGMEWRNWEGDKLGKDGKPKK